jgi:hypothetical protein
MTTQRDHLRPDEDDEDDGVALAAVVDAAGVDPDPDPAATIGAGGKRFKLASSNSRYSGDKCVPS